MPDAASAPPAGGACRWSAPSAAHVALRSWDDEWVAYVEATGTTHLLSGAAGLVAALLQDAGRPLDMAELDAAFGQFIAPLEDAAQAPHTPHDFSLQDVLHELERVGLATMHGS